MYLRYETEIRDDIEAEALSCGSRARCLKGENSPSLILPMEVTVGFYL